MRSHHVGCHRHRLHRRTRLEVDPAREHELHRIDRDAVQANREVQVRPGRATRAAHQGDDLSLADLLTLLDQNAGLIHVVIGRDEAVAVVHGDHPARQPVLRGPIPDVDHRSGRRGADWVSGGRGQVHPVVQSGRGQAGDSTAVAVPGGVARLLRRVHPAFLRHHNACLGERCPVGVLVLGEGDLGRGGDHGGRSPPVDHLLHRAGLRHFVVGAGAEVVHRCRVERLALVQRVGFARGGQPRLRIESVVDISWCRVRRSRRRRRIRVRHHSRQCGRAT